MENKFKIIDLQNNAYMSDGDTFDNYSDCIEYLRDYHSIDVEWIENYTPNEILEFEWDIVDENDNSVLEIYIIDKQYWLETEKYRIDKLLKDNIISDKDYRYLCSYLK